MSEKHTPGLGLMTQLERKQAADALSAALAGEWELTDKAHAAAVRALLKLRDPDPARLLLKALIALVKAVEAPDADSLRELIAAHAAIAKATGSKAP